MELLFRFALIGIMGFAVDASSFILIMQGMSAQTALEINTAGILAFLIAMLVTWLGNRYYTFSHAEKSSAINQLTKHCLVASGAFVLNFICFQLVLLTTGFLALAFLVGIGVGFICNFAMSKKRVFI